MSIRGPSLAALVLGTHQLARAMGQTQLADDEVRAFVEEPLYMPQVEGGGAEFWGCSVAEVITSKELRYAVLARLTTWLSYNNCVEKPSADTWCTPEIERMFDAALFTGL